jgi:hypothetical protein
MLLISNENSDEVFSSVIFDENNNELCYVGNFWFCKKYKNEQKIHQKIYMPWLTDIIFPLANVNKL